MLKIKTNHINSYFNYNKYDFSFIGDYSYLFLMPFAAVLYKEMGKTCDWYYHCFLGLTVGYGAGLFLITLIIY